MNSRGLYHLHTSDSLVTDFPNSRQESELELTPPLIEIKIIVVVVVFDLFCGRTAFWRVSHVRSRLPLIYALCLRSP